MLAQCQVCNVDQDQLNNDMAQFRVSFINIVLGMLAFKAIGVEISCVYVFHVFNYLVRRKN